MPTETKYRLMAPPIKQKKMSKNAYRAQLLGMIAKTTRNIFFNILMLCIGGALGMAFTVINIQRAWNDKLHPVEMVKIADMMMRYGIPSSDVQKALVEMHQRKLKKQEEALHQSKW